MPRFERAAIISELREVVQSGRAIIGGGAGTGLSAKCEEAGGIDLIVIYNSGRYRMAGCSSLSGLLAYGNANDIVLEMAREILPIVRDGPVLAGVNGTDPFCMMPAYLDHLKELGFSGVQNFPTIGLIDGQFRRSLEETGIRFDQEIELIRLAHERDLLTTPYVFDADQARAMAQAGADVIVAHMGLTTGGMIGARRAPTLDECIGMIDAIASAARAVRDDIFILCHGGPIVEPEDAAYILAACPHIHGFYGASSMERLPAETALIDRARSFKTLTLTPGQEENDHG